MGVVPVNPDMVILEIGCGTGLFTEFFCQWGTKIIAVDISGELLEKARRRELPPDQVRFIEKRFEDYPGVSCFDAVIGSSILHHLDMQSAVRAIFRLLKPGGFISFAEPNMLNPQIMVQKNIPYIKEKLGDSPDETAFFRWKLSRQLEEAGFGDVSVKPFDWLHPATPRDFIPGVVKIGRVLERIPFIRELAGSLHVVARRPR